MISLAANITFAKKLENCEVVSSIATQGDVKYNIFLCCLSQLCRTQLMEKSLHPKK